MRQSPSIRTGRIPAIILASTPFKSYPLYVVWEMIIDQSCIFMQCSWTSRLPWNHRGTLADHRAVNAKPGGLDRSCKGTAPAYPSYSLAGQLANGAIYRSLIKSTSISLNHLAVRLLSPTTSLHIETIYRSAYFSCHPSARFEVPMGRDLTQHHGTALLTTAYSY